MYTYIYIYCPSFSSNPSKTLKYGTPVFKTAARSIKSALIPFCVRPMVLQDVP